MGLITLNEADAVLDGTVIGEDAIGNMVAGLTVSLENACHRMLPRAVSQLSDSGTQVTLKIPVHQLRVGDFIHISVLEGGDLEGYWEVTEVIDQHQFKIDSIVTGTSSLTASVRKVLTEELSTKGRPEICVGNLPLAAVYELSRKESDGTWSVINAADFAIPDKYEDLSFTGEIYLLNSCWPTANNGERHPCGAKVRYIAGEHTAKPDLVYAFKGILKGASKRLGSGIFQNESYDYYSYSRLSSAEIGKLFGEAESIIRENRIPVA